MKISLENVHGYSSRLHNGSHLHTVEQPAPTACTLQLPQPLTIPFIKGSVPGGVEGGGRLGPPSTSLFFLNLLLKASCCPSFLLLPKSCQKLVLVQNSISQRKRVISSILSLFKLSLFTVLNNQ